MDDRHDQILVGAGLLDRTGLDYIFTPNAQGQPQPYALATWNDSNHTYRAWGNDGTTYNAPLRTTGNTMVGPAIAQALISSVATGGHLPIIADFRVPARVAAPESVTLPPVEPGGTSTASVAIAHAGDVARWTAAGLDTLRYTVSITGPFTTAPGPFAIAPGGPPASHVVFMDSAEAGPKVGTMVITSNDPEAPVVVVPLSGSVLPPPACAPDFNGDGTLDPDDLADYIACYFGLSRCPAADFNHDGTTDPDDLSDFIAAYFAGC
ncbi:MAG: hypothetical protein JNK35_10195 [Phycisphaerae bacterium]|nr:hypothetical protein [Phycisphaerae bacterium]